MRTILEAHMFIDSLEEPLYKSDLQDENNNKKQRFGVLDEAVSMEKQFGIL